VKAFTLSKEAERDLDSIARYLREKAGIRVARHVLRELRSGIRFIAKNPDSGHFRQDLTADAVKFWSVFSYLIVYDPARRPVEIVRVLHGRRDIGRILN
jgi:toxin ParE1/3/4